MKLTLEIIESFGFDKKTIRPDYDDAGYEFKLPYGLRLVGYFMLNHCHCETNMLEGLDGYICVETKEELEELIPLSFEETLKKVKEKHPKFDINDWI